MLSGYQGSPADQVGNTREGVEVHGCRKQQPIPRHLVGEQQLSYSNAQCLCLSRQQRSIPNCRTNPAFGGQDSTLGSSPGLRMRIRKEEP